MNNETFFEFDLYVRLIGSFSIDDGNGSENVSFKMNSPFFQSLSRLFQFAENGKYRRISLELILEDRTQV